MQSRQVKYLMRDKESLSNDGTEGEQAKGVGVSIINEFVSHHKGQLEINSVPAKGTTVNCTFSMN